MKTLVTFMLFAISTLLCAQDKESRPILGTTTVVKAVLTQKLISDYTGPFRAYITHDVYDTNNEYILIPKGSKVLGQVIRIGNVNEPISARVGYLINSIIRPDNIVIDMKNDSALDHEGVSGIEDKVNRHLLAQFLGVSAYALITSGADGGQTGGLTGEVDVKQEIENQAREQYATLAAKYLNLVPTITIRSGQTFNIFIVKPKIVEPYGSIYDDILS